MPRFIYARITTVVPKLLVLFTRAVKSMSFIKTESPRDSYKVEVTSLPEELNYPKSLPKELLYVLTKNKARWEEVHKILSNGMALGVRTVEKTPEEILKTVNHISTISQHFLILSWLPSLLKNGKMPVFTEADQKKAESLGINLTAEAEYILKHKLEFKKFVLIDEENRGIAAPEQSFMRLLNEDLYDISVDYIVERVIFDNAHERTETAQTIIKALLFIGPITHQLEKFAQGIGKVFAASTDDLMSEAAELMALRGSGFSWRVLYKRSLILIPVFIIATVMAFRVEHYIDSGSFLLAGIFFGTSAVALSLTTAIQSIFMYLGSVKKASDEGKLQGLKGKPRLLLALEQDFTNPARLGLFIGALSAPIIGMISFAFLTNFLHNGWFLALIGSTESIVAGVTVLTARKINDLLYFRKLQRAINST